MELKIILIGLLVGLLIGFGIYLLSPDEDNCDCEECSDHEER